MWYVARANAFPSHPVVLKLDVEYNELVQRWKRLNDDVPPEDSVEFKERGQNLGDVIHIVRDAQPLWKASPRRHIFSHSVKLAEDFLSSFIVHDTLLDLPEIKDHDIYLSLIHGVLQSLIKVSTPAFLSSLFCPCIPLTFFG